jgi:uncharacterized protein YjbI with pentapeptide repeats
MSDSYTREQILDYLLQKGSLTSYTTADILQKIASARASGSKVSFAGENLAGIDLSQETIRREFQKGGYSESTPPLWYSGDLKRDELRKKPATIASAREPAAVEVASKRAVDLEGADFSNSDLEGANFEGADLAQANFQGARLHYANLSRARLWDANFTRARLAKAVLTGAALQNADFSWANLRGAILNRCLLYHVHLQNTEIERGQIEEIWEEKRAKEEEKAKRDSRRHYADAASAYNRLKNNFVSIGKHDNAGWAFIKEKRMERKTRRRFSPAWWFNLFMDVSCGYGEQPWKVLILAVIIPISFGFVYWGLEGIQSTVEPVLINWYDYFVFSLRSFVTLAFADMNPASILTKILSTLEAAFGVSLFALLMYSLGRRISGY